MYRTSYKVKYNGTSWVIEAYCDCEYSYTLELEFYNEESSHKVCKVLNEEVEEAYGNGQISTY